MRILVVGGGGREHALIWKLRQSPEVTEIFCAPGNAGIRSLADCIPIEPSDIVELADFAEKLSIGLTVVGPELPLILGLVDEFQRRGLAVFGPTRAASELEGSKAFAKDFLKRHKIPTARYHVVSSTEEAKAVLDSGEVGLPVVVKADGLAGGKGVVIADSKAEAMSVAQGFIENRQLGSAGTRLVIEEFLEGDEVSFFALSDGHNVLPLVAAQDHKRAFDNDEGPNTGGMGSICPATILNADTLKHIVKDVVHPTISGLATEGRKYQGILYAGLMLTADGPKVLEFNVRLGDPEAQALLPRLKSDLVSASARSEPGSPGTAPTRMGSGAGGDRGPRFGRAIPPSTTSANRSKASIPDRSRWTKASTSFTQAPRPRTERSSPPAGASAR